MAGYSTQSFDICYRSDIPGGAAAVSLAYYFPAIVWTLLAGGAFYDNDIYRQLLSSSWWIAFAVRIVISEANEQPRPQPFCNNDGWGMNSWESQLAYHFVAMMLIDRIVFRNKISFPDYFTAFMSIGIDAIRTLFLVFFVPFWIAYNGNYTAWQVIAGALLGAGTGAYIMLWVYVFWRPRFLFLTDNGPILSVWDYVRPRDEVSCEQGGVTGEACGRDIVQKRENGFVTWRPW